MRLARVLGAVGRTLITAGVLILLFVAYQLWGTGLHEAKAQDKLENEFEAQLKQFATTTLPPTPGEPTTTLLPPPAPKGGEGVAHILIPRIGVDKIVVQGVTLEDLKKGPGHYPETPMPGNKGNAAIAGHRTTYGAPFNRIDELKPKDPILITTVQGTFRYEVMAHPDSDGKNVGHLIVSPTQTEILDDMHDNRLTLTSCNPKYSARERIVVTAKLVKNPAPTPSTTTTTAPHTEAPTLELSGEGAPALPAILWGLLAALIWLVAWLVGRRWRKWPAYAIGLPFFLVVLFIFFENFSRLLPSNF